MGARLSYPVVDLAGKVAVVTGGNTGIGYETAKALVLMGAQTIIACRSKERATAAIQRMKGEIADQSPEKDPKIEFMLLDLASFHSTKEFVSAFRDRNLPLHLLINNAGVFFTTYSKTPDGYESNYQVNHLSPFLLTLELLPIILESAASTGDCRVINVSSVAHTNAVWNPDNMVPEPPPSWRVLYGNSKCYNIMTAHALQRRLQNVGVTVSCLHPGVIKTELFRHWEDRWFTYILIKPVKPFFRSVPDGAATTLNCAVNPELNSQKCMYYSDCRPTESSAVSRNEEHQEQLWENSVSAVRDYLSPETLERYGPAHRTNQSAGSTE